MNKDKKVWSSLRHHKCFLGTSNVDSIEETMGVQLESTERTAFAHLHGVSTLLSEGLFPTTSNQVHVCWVWRLEFDLWKGLAFA